MEMQGRFEEGVRWMGSRIRWWSGAGPASTHLWWHLALYHLELGQPAHALLLYDRRMQGEGLSELIDGGGRLTLPCRANSVTNGPPRRTRRKGALAWPVSPGPPTSGATML